MKNFLIMAFCLSFFFSIAFSQDSPKFEKIIFKDAQFENEYVKVEIDNIVSMPKETKFRMRITNKTNDFLIYNSKESNFDITGQDVRSKEKSFIIEPNDSKRKVFRAFGENLNSIKQFAFICEGFYLVKNQDPTKVENFKLPVSNNFFNAGQYDVTLANVSKESKKTDVKFNVTYKGENIGFVFPSRISVLMPDKITYASANTKDEILVLKKGESDSFSASWDRMPGGKENDMQLVEMFVLFNNVFIEGVPTKISGQKVMIDWDEAATIGKK